jgi:hypothetical protein
MGGDFAAPIAEYPNFEQPEADGESHVRRRRMKGRPDDGMALDRDRK